MQRITTPYRGTRWAFLGFCLLGIMVLNIIEIELSGFLFVVTFLLSLSYFGGRWCWKRWRKTEETDRYRYREALVLVTVAFLLNVMAAGESYPRQMPLTLIFGELAFFCLPLFYWLYKRRRGHDRIYLLGLSGIALLGVAALVFSITTVVLVDTPGDYDSVAGLIFLALFTLLFATGVRWLVRQVKAVMRLKNEQAQSEIKHLQNQVNPHFFFNMLNNLYGLVGQDQQKAQQLILQLSDLMRYSIYDGQKEDVSLGEEVAYLENYIALQELRYQKEIRIHFTKTIDDEGYRLLPLLFIILVENAFKHGVEQLRKGAYIDLDITARDGQIVFTIENNYDPEDQPASVGVGLANLRRRLELAYPGRHELRIQDDGAIHQAGLSLVL